MRMRRGIVRCLGVNRTLAGIATFYGATDRHVSLVIDNKASNQIGQVLLAGTDHFSIGVRPRRENADAQREQNKNKIFRRDFHECFLSYASKTVRLLGSINARA